MEPEDKIKYNNELNSQETTGENDLVHENQIDINLDTEILDVLDQETFDHICSLYNRISNQPEAYSSTMAQYLDPSLFRELLENPNVKKVISKDSEQLLGIALLTNDIALSPILSPNFYDQLPKNDTGSPIFLLATLAVEPNIKYQSLVEKELFDHCMQEISINSTDGYLTFVDTKKCPSPTRRQITENVDSDIHLSSIATAEKAGVDEESCYLCQWTNKPTTEIKRRYEMEIINGPIVDKSLIEKLWSLNQEILAELNTQSPFIQFYPRDYFDNLMSSNTVSKYILRDGDEIIGVGLMTNKLENEPLLSDKTVKSAPYVNTFGKVDCNLIMFVGVKPGLKNFDAITELLGDMMCSIDKEDTGMFLYSKEHNSAIPRLATLVAKRRSGEITGHDIDSEICHLYKWEKEIGVQDE